ncbi:hypothetical protein PsorP6_011872 [Peronosclerospora sorghi]|uniref:Uncharacterized protein n=1 Tax=Peronosclerospora sorghi TaxID=230839 RepID=A0ACC0WID2_9STRA|nr:hypothetical protein PsorP6_011872 [Peronosclerospora sorghi]
MLRDLPRRILSDYSSSTEFPYAIVIGAAVGFLAILFISVGLCWYCKERRRDQKLTLESMATLTSNPPASQFSPGLHATEFSAVTSPVPNHPLSLARSISRESLNRFDEEFTHTLNSVGENPDPFDPSTPSRRNSFKHSHTETFLCGEKGLWNDPVILAARIPIENIRVGEVISRGGFGEILKGTYQTQPVALKRLLPETRTDLANIETFLTEVKLQATLAHERIVRFLGVAWDTLANLCVVSEFMEHGDLRALLLHLDESEHRAVGFDAEKAHIALDVAHALVYLHALAPKVVHRDLKSRNILLETKWRAKLTDFGVARERSDRTMTAGVGTSLWMAPEVMMGERYDERADLFSFGVVLSELDSHQLPYAREKVTETGRVIPDAAILQLVSSGALSVHFTPPTSAAADLMVHLATACVALDPARRPTAAQAFTTNATRDKNSIR